MRTAILVAALALGSAAQAGDDDWLPLDGAGIAEALTGAEVAYENARQIFYASGKTLYEFGQPSWGNWRVEGNRYCSQWPPGETWDCYDVEMSADGTSIRFLDAHGNVFAGVIR